MLNHKVVSLTICIFFLGLLTCNPLVVYAYGPGSPRIGVAGINSYVWPGSGLTWAIKSADDLYNQVSSLPGWSGSGTYDIHDYSVYPEKFTRSEDYNWVDNVDLGFFSGHGAPDSIAASPINRYVALASDCTWGDQHAKWIGLDACNCGNGIQFRNCMNGLHELCTFCTYSRDCNPTMGGQWGYYLTPPGPFPVLDGWICAGRDVECSGDGMRVFYASGDDMDHLWGQGSVGPNPTGSTPVYSVTVYK